MNRIKKALAGSGAAALIAGAAMVGLTATPAEAANPLDCWWLEQQATAAFNTSQYYHNLGTFYAAAESFSLAADFFSLEREWNVNWLNVQVC